MTTESSGITKEIREYTISLCTNINVLYFPDRPEKTPEITVNLYEIQL
jgi:hypothetical protein